MSATPIEDLGIGFKTYTTSHLDTYLTAIETGTTGDTVQLPDLAIRSYGYRDVLAQKEYPAGSFVVTAVRLEPGASQTDLMTVSASLIMGVTDNDPEVLAKKLDRYPDAVRAMIAADETLGGLCLIARVNDIELYPAAQGAKDIAVAVVNVDLVAEVVT